MRSLIGRHANEFLLESLSAPQFAQIHQTNGRTIPLTWTLYAFDRLRRFVEQLRQVITRTRRQ
jgi:hypothetical protein